MFKFKRYNFHLRAARRRCGLSQDDLAALLGFASADQVSRFERAERAPDLKTALAYEFVLGAPARTIFPDAHAAAVRAVAERAQLLIERLSVKRPSPLIEHRLDRLKKLVEDAGAVS